MGDTSLPPRLPTKLWKMVWWDEWYQYWEENGKQYLERDSWEWPQEFATYDDVLAFLKERYHERLGPFNP